MFESKHDLYAMYLTDEEVETVDNWIMEDKSDSFTEATTMKMSYINDIVVLESRARAEAEHEEVRNKEREQIQRIIDQTAIRRKTAQIVFETSCQSVINILESDKGTISTIQKFQLQLEVAFKECKQTNKELLNLLTKESAESEIRWIHDIQRKYNGIIEKLDVQIDKDEQLKESKQKQGLKYQMYSYPVASRSASAHNENVYNLTRYCDVSHYKFRIFILQWLSH